MQQQLFEKDIKNIILLQEKLKTNNTKIALENEKINTIKKSFEKALDKIFQSDSLAKENIINNYNEDKKFDTQKFTKTISDVLANPKQYFKQTSENKDILKVLKSQQFSTSAEEAQQKKLILKDKHKTNLNTLSKNINNLLSKSLDNNMLKEINKQYKEIKNPQSKNIQQANTKTASRSR
jgi:hypothetical protein